MDSALPLSGHSYPTMFVDANVTIGADGTCPTVYCEVSFGFSRLNVFLYAADFYVRSRSAAILELKGILHTSQYAI